MKFDKTTYQTFANGGMKENKGKRDYTLLPFSVMDRVVDIMAYGAVKYSRDNWMSVSPLEYIKAALRHIIAYIKGELIDPESNFTHLDHAICNLIYASFNRTPLKQEESSE